MKILKKRTLNLFKNFKHFYLNNFLRNLFLFLKFIIKNEINIDKNTKLKKNSETNFQKSSFYNLIKNFITNSCNV